MSEAFGDAAVRLCAAAATLLGWRPAEFWQATPAELATCLGEGTAAMQSVSSATLEELRQRFPD